MKRGSDKPRATLVVTWGTVQQKKMIDTYARSRGLSTSSLIQMVVINALEENRPVKR